MEGTCPLHFSLINNEMVVQLVIECTISIQSDFWKGRVDNVEWPIIFRSQKLDNSLLTDLLLMLQTKVLLLIPGNTEFRSNKYCFLQKYRNFLAVVLYSHNYTRMVSGILDASNRMLRESGPDCLHEILVVVIVLLGDYRICRLISLTMQANDNSIPKKFRTLFFHCVSVGIAESEKYVLCILKDERLFRYSDFHELGNPTKQTSNLFLRRLLMITMNRETFMSQFSYLSHSQWISLHDPLLQSSLKFFSSQKRIARQQIIDTPSGLVCNVVFMNSFSFFPFEWARSTLVPRILRHYQQWVSALPWILRDITRFRDTVGTVKSNIHDE